MKLHLARVLVGSVLLLAANLSTHAATDIVYDNLSTSALGGYGQANANLPVFGDALNLTRSGRLAVVGLSLYNSSSGGNTGSITNGTMLLSFYDNTVPYTGTGPLSGKPLLGTATVTWDFTTDGGLSPGFYDTQTFDLSALNINLTQNIFITQRFTEILGTSTQNGIILFGNPTVGTSPNNVYISSTTTTEGLYTFSGGIPNQFGYHIELVPEPATCALGGLAAAAFVIFRRRK
jgi:hypothetical protein